jgi:hypothetical protein
MNEPENYNGWKNYPTWAVNLWLSNDEGLYHETLERVRAGKWSGGMNHAHAHVANEIKTFVRDELAPDLGASFAADLLGYALDEVDWYEIADAWIEQV